MKLTSKVGMARGSVLHQRIGLVCKQAPSRIIKHHALNNVVARAIQSARIPVTKEPVGLTRLDGKRPDGLTLIPWQGGKPLTWDVTVVSTLAASYLSPSAWSADARKKCVGSTSTNRVKQKCN